MNECFIKIKKLFPFIKNTEIDSYWIGLMPFSIYNKPIVGNFSCFGYPNIWIANGFGPSGIAIGPMTTKLLSNIISSNDIEAKLLLEKFNVIDGGCKII